MPYKDKTDALLYAKEYGKTEKHKLASTRWRKNNREKANRAAREWNSRNKGKREATRRRWAEKNPFRLPFAYHLSSAKRRNLSTVFTDISLFTACASKPCLYCGAEPAFGIDRLDPTLPYTVENSAPCCKTCNWCKHTLGLQEFYAWIDRVQAYRLL